MRRYDDNDDDDRDDRNRGHRGRHYGCVERNNNKKKGRLRG